MTTEFTHLVLRDDDGNYYVFSQEALAKARVPEERVAAIEEYLQAGDEVVGYNGMPGSMAGSPLAPFSRPSSIAQQNFQRIAAHMDAPTQQAFVWWLSAVGAYGPGNVLLWAD